MPEGSRMDDTGQHFLESAQLMLQSLVMWRAVRRSSLSDIIQRLIIDKKLRTKEFQQMEEAPDARPLIRQGIAAFNGAGDRQRGAMDSTLSRKLRPFLDDAIRYVTTPEPNEEKWSFEDIYLMQKPMVVFIEAGLGTDEFGGALTRVVVGDAINTVRRLWNTRIAANKSAKEARLPKGLWIFVDEARSMGNCVAVVDAVNELRKAGVNVFLCFHTLADVK